MKKNNCTEKGHKKDCTCHFLNKSKSSDLTIKEKLEASEAKLKELLKGKGRNVKLEKSANRAMSPQSIGKLLEDLDNGEDES